jgi:hypothetical protein
MLAEIHDEFGDDPQQCWVWDVSINEARRRQRRAS